MKIVLYSAVFFIIFFLEIFYFKIARKFKIIDQPNERSSHSKSTIRGAGIIFPISILLSILFYQINIPYFFIGLTLISIISFWDDVQSVKNKIRITIHFLSVALLFYQLNFFNQNGLIIILAFILVIGLINTYNFMDGINGISVTYTLVTACTLAYINVEFFYVDKNLIYFLILSSIVFAFFNFRKKALCFSGDVGSVSIAFILCFFVLSLMLKTNSFKWILLFGIYGLDSIATIVFRLARKENIFKAHRSHFYQFLSNQLKISQLAVALLYAFVQLILNFSLCFFSKNISLSLFTVFILSYLILRFRLEGTNKLLRKY